MLERQRKQSRKQRHCLGQGEAGALQDALQGCEVGIGTVVALEFEIALQEIDYGMERAVLVVGGTTGGKFGRMFAGDAFAQHPYEARFTDASLSAEQYDLPGSCPSSLPA